MFSMKQGVPSVMGYVNSDYAGYLDDMRSTTGHVFTLAMAYMLEIINSMHSNYVYNRGRIHSSS